MSVLQQAARVLNQDGVLIYPTETTYAIGTKLDSAVGIKKLYKIKGRTKGQPTSAVCSDINQIANYCYLTKSEVALAKSCWPGPLTICLLARKNVPHSLLAPDGTLGVRIPSFPWLIKLIRAAGVPILSPSANFKGGKAPTKLTQIDKKLSDLVDYVVDIEPEGKSPSTIVKLTDGKVNIIREGSIKKSEILERLKGVSS